MSKFSRFIYLNTYSFLLLFCGVAVALIPLFKVSVWLVIPQALACLFFLRHAFQLFSTYKDKKIKYAILCGKNKDNFRPESFEVFMQAPCGRLLTKAVLKDLNLSEKYKELLVYKPTLRVSMKNACAKQETKIYYHKVNA